MGDGVETVVVIIAIAILSPVDVAGTPCPVTAVVSLVDSIDSEVVAMTIIASLVGVIKVVEMTAAVSLIDDDFEVVGVAVVVSLDDDIVAVGVTVTISLVDMTKVVGLSIVAVAVVVVVVVIVLLVDTIDLRVLVETVFSPDIISVDTSGRI